MFFSNSGNFLKNSQLVPLSCCFINLITSYDKKNTMILTEQFINITYGNTKILALKRNLKTTNMYSEKTTLGKKRKGLRKKRNRKKKVTSTRRSKFETMKKNLEVNIEGDNICDVFHQHFLTNWILQNLHGRIPIISRNDYENHPEVALFLKHAFYSSNFNAFPFGERPGEYDYNITDVINKCKLEKNI